MNSNRMPQNIEVSIALGTLIGAAIGVFEKDANLGIAWGIAVSVSIFALLLARRHIGVILNSFWRTISWELVGERKAIQSLLLALDELVRFFRVTAQQGMASRLLRLEGAEHATIIHSHRPGANHQSYIQAGIPLDEVEMVLQVWHWLSDRLDRPKIRQVCSCDEALQLASGYDLGHLVIIGSTKHNPLVDRLQCVLNEKDLLLYVFHTDTTEKDPEKRQVKLISAPGMGYEELVPIAGQIDYGMILSCPNPWDHGGRILLVGGCHRYAQLGIQEWLSRPSNMADILCRYPDPNFQLVLQQEYSLKTDGSYTLKPAKLIRHHNIRTGEVS